MLNRYVELKKVLAATLVAAAAGAVAAPSALAGNLFTTIGITSFRPDLVPPRDTRANGQINGGWTFPAEEMPDSGTVAVPAGDTPDNVPVRMPDTTGEKVNLAAFRGQPFTLRQDLQKPYAKVHFFGTTTDSSGGGPITLRFADGTTETVTVNFPDWCQPGNANAHVAIGRMTGRYTRSGGKDTAPCSIFHYPVTISAANAGKTFLGITLPPSTNNNPTSVVTAYLMGMTLETAGGQFETPDISAADQFPNDKTGPSTTAEIKSDAAQADGWYKGAVSVTIRGTDPGVDQAGVEQIQYRIDGGNTQTEIVQPQNSTLTIPVSAEGPHVFEYRSVDGVGNSENFKSVSVRIDTSAPTTTPLPGTAYGIDGWYDGPVAVNFLANDGAGSGVVSAEWRYRGDTPEDGWHATTEGVGMIDRSGTSVIEYRSTDKLGNVEAIKTLELKIDAKAPVSILKINDADPAAIYTAPVRLAITRDDGNGSGATGTQYRLNGGAWTAFTGAADVVGNGTYRLDYRSEDLLGNVELYQSHTFTVAIPFVAPTVLQAPSTTRPAPFAALEEVPSRLRTRSALRNGRLAVKLSCQSVASTTVSLIVSKATARRLKLKSTTIARRTVACGNEGRATATLKPSATVKRALARYKRSFEATL